MTPALIFLGGKKPLKIVLEAQVVSPPPSPSRYPVTLASCYSPLFVPAFPGLSAAGPTFNWSFILAVLTLIPGFFYSLARDPFSVACLGSSSTVFLSLCPLPSSFLQELLSEQAFWNLYLLLIVTVCLASVVHMPLLCFRIRLPRTCVPERLNRSLQLSLFRVDLFFS